MTGTERLRALAGALGDYGWGQSMSGWLGEIADQIEREARDGENRRVELCAALGIDAGTGWSDAVDEMRRRLMPDGCEWPRYEDGEPVPIGGEFMGKDGKTYTAKQIQFIGKCFSLFDFCDRKPQFSGFYGERVKDDAGRRGGNGRVMTAEPVACVQQVEGRDVIGERDMSGGHFGYYCSPQDLDDERREVARRLRSLRMTAPGVTSLGHGYLWSLLWAVSGEELGESNRCDWFERMCSRIAALVDPSDGREAPDEAANALPSGGPGGIASMDAPSQAAAAVGAPDGRAGDEKN